jgi:DNA-binding GntR family transcriptional regulator
MKRIELYRELRFRNVDTGDAKDFACITGIIKAVLAGNLSKALARLKDHIKTTRNSLLAGLKTS